MDKTICKDCRQEKIHCICDWKDDEAILWD